VLLVLACIATGWAALVVSSWYFSHDPEPPGAPAPTSVPHRDTDVGESIYGAG
jgi:hypothetical protein